MKKRLLTQRMNLKGTVIAMLLAVVALGTQAQMVDPVKFDVQLKTGPSAEGELVFSAKIAPGWHVYSTRLGGDGPIEASFHAVKMEGVEPVGTLEPRGKEIKKFDKVFDMTLRYFEGTATFVQRVRFTRPVYAIDCYLEYGACNDEMCLPPGEAAFKQSGKSPEVAAATNQPSQSQVLAQEASDGQARLTESTTSNVDTIPTTLINEKEPMEKLQAADSALLWKPVVKELRALGGAADTSQRSLWYIFLMGVVGGLLALLMPCIWPIIPMTVSFFLKRAKDDRRRGVRDAVIYGASIVVIFLALGLLLTAWKGPGELNELSTSAGFNLFLFALLVVFALSFFGWFELKLPDSWANSVDSRASRATGLLSIFLMATTLVLVSFSCTAPIVGLLLVETVTTGDWSAPTIGMLGFALALAVPFALFALFPQWLKSLPKSGSWMTQIKVVLGFIELAFSLKFLSVADLAYGWHILDREVFLSLWIVIFGALGLYLIGKLKFPADEVGGDTTRAMPVPCIMLGLGSLAFALYMVPGLWGAPCKAVSAFAPPMYTQDFNLNQQHVEARYHDYEQGMAAAQAEDKPVLLDFTGFGCVNCRKMEAAVWTDPQVARTLTRDYVLISLFVDDKTPLSQPVTVTLNGKQLTLRTVGDKWSYLQAEKFGANAQPFYVAVSPDGRPLVPAHGYKEDVGDYLNFLQQGLEKYKTE